LKIESDADFPQTRCPHRMPEPRFVLRVEHQKSSSTGADQFAAKCSVLAGKIVPGVNVRITHAFGSLSFLIPMHLHQFGVLSKIARFQSLLACPSKLLSEVQVIYHRRVSGLAPFILIAQHFRGRSIVTRVEQNEVVFEVGQGLRADFQWTDNHSIIGAELKTRDAAEGSDVLILFTDRLTKPLDLYMTGLFGEVFLRHDRLGMNVQSLKESSQKTSAGAKSGSRWNIGHTRDLEIAGLLIGKSQRLPDQRVLDVLEPTYSLHLGVLNDEIFEKGLVKSDVNVFVNGGGNNKAAVLSIVRRQVGSAPAERNPQRAPRNDQLLTPL
jgi:hypothetical protein